jgi:hypothetical protein
VVEARGDQFWNKTGHFLLGVVTTVAIAYAVSKATR